MKEWERLEEMILEFFLIEYMFTFLACLEEAPLRVENRNVRLWFL